MIRKLKTIAQNPATKEALKNIKPKKNFWGIFSVIAFLILPEIAAFIWGGDISAYCQVQLSQDLPLEEQYLYEGLEMLMGEGSYFNLLFGFGLLLWLFF